MHNNKHDPGGLLGITSTQALCNLHDKPQVQATHKTTDTNTPNRRLIMPSQHSACRHLILNTLLLTSLIANGAWATDYYVDNISGNNANTGLNGAPWSDVSVLKKRSFSPGDVIHLKRGQTWHGQGIVLESSGTADHPITITNYGLHTDPLPLVSMAAPLDKEALANGNLDIHKRNPLNPSDQFFSWATTVSGNGNTLKASADSSSGKGSSVRLQKLSLGTVSLRMNTPKAIAANMPLTYRFRVKAPSGNLEVKIRNLVTKNYLNANDEWGAEKVPAISLTNTKTWTDVVLDFSNDTAIGQIQLDFNLVSGTAYVDNLEIQTAWVPIGKNLYKRTFIPAVPNGIYSVYIDNTLGSRKTSLAALSQDLDWYIEKNERVFYMYYNGDLLSLESTPIFINRGRYIGIDLQGEYLHVDGIAIEKSNVGIRVRENNTVIANNELRLIDRCAIEAFKANKRRIVPLFNLGINNNNVHNSGCGIYVQRLHNSLMSNNRVHDIYDRGTKVDTENIAIQSGRNNIIENNIVYNGQLLGIDLYGNQGRPALNNIIRNNLIYNNGYVGILVGGGHDNHGIPGGEIRGYAYNNLFHNNICFGNGFGEGFETRGSGMRQNNTPADGFSRNLWYNNTLYANRINFSGQSGFAGGFDYKNNISLSPAYRHLDFGDGRTNNRDLTITDLSHNLYFPDGRWGDGLFNWHGIYDSFADFQVGSRKDLIGSAAVDPLLTNPSRANFLPTSVSPAIDAATAVGLSLDHSGSNVLGLPDIGALEYPPPATINPDIISP